ncbi:MAG: HAD family phosphatase [Rubrivivax sp.]|nr:MAG: HAD family phosphatase [Rubrivivax sp.]
MRPAVTVSAEGFVFDMDGLLVNTESLARKALRLAGDEIGLDLPDSLCHLMIGVPADGCRRLLYERYGKNAPADPLFDAAARHMEAQISAGRLRCQPGALALLDELDRRSMPRAVATSSSRVKAARHLSAASITHRFDAIVTRDDVANGKPWPDLFVRAAEALGLPPAHCLALEDSYNGVRAAHAAGMPVIMVPDLLPANDEMRSLCLDIVESLEAIPAMLPTHHPSGGRQRPGRLNRPQ